MKRTRLSVRLKSHQDLSEWKVVSHEILVPAVH